MLIQSRWNYVNVRGFGALPVAPALRLSGDDGPWGRWGMNQRSELTVVKQAAASETTDCSLRPLSIWDGCIGTVVDSGNHRPFPLTSAMENDMVSVASHKNDLQSHRDVALSTKMSKQISRVSLHIGMKRVKQMIQGIKVQEGLSSLRRILPE